MNKSKTIYFLRHSKLVLPYKDHSEMPFSVLCDLGSNRLNPPVDIEYTKTRIQELEKIISFNEITKIYSSPSVRAQETTKLMSDNIEIITLPELDEVHFELEKLITEDKINSVDLEKRIPMLNSAVFNSMISGSYCEPIIEINKRVHIIFENIKNLPKGNYIFISHDFIMRVIEIYIKNKGNNVDITQEMLEQTRRNGYLTGFMTDSELSTFEVIQ